MDLSKIKKWFTAHRNAVLGTAAVATAGAAYYAHTHTAAASVQVTPSVVSPATVAADDGTDTSAGGGGANGVPDADSQVTWLQQIDGDLGTVSGQLSTLTGQLGNPPPADTTGSGKPPSAPVRTGRNAPRAGAKTTAAMIDSYVIETDAKTGLSYDVTSRGTVHRLTPSQLARDAAAGATRVVVAARPTPAAAPRPKHRPAPPKAAKPKKKK